MWKDSQDWDKEKLRNAHIKNEINTQKQLQEPKSVVIVESDENDLDLGFILIYIIFYFTSFIGRHKGDYRIGIYYRTNC